MVYEKEIMETKTNMNLIPAYASMNEAVFYVLEDNEKNFSQMIQNIGLKELAVYESTGNVLLYEEGSQEAKVAEGEKSNFVAKAWANIRAAFEAAIRKLGELVNKVTTALQGAVTKATAGVAAKASKKKSADQLKNEIDKLSDNFISGLNKSSGYKYDKMGKFKPVFGDDLKSAFDKANEDADAQQRHTNIQQIKDVLGVDEINPQTVRGALRGGKESITKEAIKSNFDAIYSSVTDTKSTQAALKSYYQNAKEVYNKFIKAVKKGANDKDTIGNTKAIVQATSVIYTAILSEYYAIIMRNAKIVLKLNALANKAGGAKKEDKKEDKKEENKPGAAKPGDKVEAETLDEDGNVVDKGTATHTESAEIDSEIASLFDWSF